MNRNGISAESQGEKRKKRRKSGFSIAFKKREKRRGEGENWKPEGKKKRRDFLISLFAEGGGKKKRAEEVNSDHHLKGSDGAEEEKKQGCSTCDSGEKKGKRGPLLAQHKGEGGGGKTN